MIKIKVNKPIAIPNTNSKQRSLDLRPGIHEVEDNILEHWFVRSLIKGGVISIIQKKKSGIVIKEGQAFPITKKPEIKIEEAKPIIEAVPEVKIEEAKVEEIKKDNKVLFVATEEIPEEIAYQKITIDNNVPFVGKVELNVKANGITKIRNKRK